MKSLDLHKKRYEEAKILVSTFIENNIDNLPVEIITGNSVDMRKIVLDIANKHNLSANPRTFYNLGALKIDNKS